MCHPVNVISLVGFGVCCLFLLSGYSTVTRNCTYARNTNFPSTESSGTSGTVTFRNRQSMTSILDPLSGLG